MELLSVNSYRCELRTDDCRQSLDVTLRSSFQSELIAKGAAAGRLKGERSFATLQKQPDEEEVRACLEAVEK